MAGTTSRSRIKWAVLGVALGGVFLLIAARGLNFSEILQVLRGANVALVLVTVAGSLGFMLLKSLRWRVILEPSVSVSFGLLHWATYAGTASNLVLVHSGEVLRALVVGRRTSSSPSAILASIAIERIFDMIAVVTLFSIMLLAGLNITRSVAAAALVAAGLIAVALAGLWILLKPSRLRETCSRLATAVMPGPLRKWLSHQARQGIGGLKALGSPRTLFATFMLSLLQWSCIVAAIWFSVAALDHPVTVPAAIGVWVLMVIGLTLPSSPAQLGTTQLAYTVGLALTEANHEIAFAASVIYTSAVNLPMMIIGSLCWLMIRSSDVALKRAVQDS